jgi:hypothetical protein
MPLRKSESRYGKQKGVEENGDVGVSFRRQICYHAHAWIYFVDLKYSGFKINHHSNTSSIKGDQRQNLQWCDYQGRQGTSQGQEDFELSWYLFFQHSQRALNGSSSSSSWTTTSSSSSSSTGGGGATVAKRQHNCDVRRCNFNYCLRRQW